MTRVLKFRQDTHPCGPRHRQPIFSHLLNGYGFPDFRREWNSQPGREDDLQRILQQIEVVFDQESVCDCSVFVSDKANARGPGRRLVHVRVSNEKDLFFFQVEGSESFHRTRDGVSDF